MNFAGQNGQSFVWESWGTLPLCERMRETVPSFLYSTLPAVIGGGGGCIELFPEVAGDSIDPKDVREDGPGKERVFARNGVVFRSKWVFPSRSNR